MLCSLDQHNAKSGSAVQHNAQTRKSVRAAVSGSHKESDDVRNFFVKQNAVAGGEDSEAPAMAWETLSSQD